MKQLLWLMVLLLASMPAGCNCRCDGRSTRCPPPNTPTNDYLYERLSCGTCGDTGCCQGKRQYYACEPDRFWSTWWTLFTDDHGHCAFQGTDSVCQ